MINRHRVDSSKTQDCSESWGWLYHLSQTSPVERKIIVIRKFIHIFVFTNFCCIRSGNVGVEIVEGEVVFGWSYPVSVEVKWTHNLPASVPQIQVTHNIMTSPVSPLHEEDGHHLPFVDQFKLPEN